MVTRKELADDDQRLIDYHESYELSQEAHIDEASKLKKRRRRAGEEERDEIDIRLLDNAADIALLDAKFAAFEANRAAINPPSDQQLKKLREIVDKVEKLNVNQAILSEAIALTTEALNTFNQIQPSDGN